MLWILGSPPGSHTNGKSSRGGRRSHHQAPMSALQTGGQDVATAKSATRGYGRAMAPWRRRLALRQRPTTSVVVTVTFVLIFTCIITMEVLFIDEDNRLKGLAKTGDEDGAVSSDFVYERKLDLQEGTKGRSDRMAPDLQFDQTIPLKQAAGGAGRALHQEPDGGGPSGGVWLPGNASFSRGDWQPVTGAKAKFYVYSAYLDTRQGRFVRIVGATRTRGSDKCSCVYWYDAPGATPISVPAAIKVIRENWNLKYSAVFVLCPLFVFNVGRALPVPDEVSVIVGTDNPVGNRLTVLNRNGSGGAQIKEGFAVCVKPLHYNFNRALQLIEFIELNLILGVQHFTFYNHTIGPDVECVLRDYIRKGLVTLLPWQLDMVSQKEIRTEGLFAAINDCLYRNMYLHRHLLMIDIDEFIVPHRNATLASMFVEFEKKINVAKAGSFSFMNSFFYLQWPNDPNGRSDPVPLVTLRKTKRRSKFHPHKQRSKCILVANVVVEMGNHFVWEFLPGKGAVNVPPEIAFLHHYRVCEFGGNDCVKTQAITDRTVYRYKTELMKRVMTRIEMNRNGMEEEACQGLNLTVVDKR